MKRLIEALVLLVLAASVGAAGAVSIVAVTPQGEVAQVRQVTVKFSDAVVAFGDPRLADPLAIACQGSVPAGTGDGPTTASGSTTSASRSVRERPAPRASVPSGARRRSPASRARARLPPARRR